MGGNLKVVTRQACTFLEMPSAGYLELLGVMVFTALLGIVTGADAWGQNPNLMFGFSGEKPPNHLGVSVPGWTRVLLP